MVSSMSSRKSEEFIHTLQLVGLEFGDFKPLAWKSYLQMHLLAKRLVFFSGEGWLSEVSEWGSSIKYFTNVASKLPNYFSVVTSIVYGN